MNLVESVFKQGDGHQAAEVTGAGERPPEETTGRDDAGQRGDRGRFEKKVLTPHAKRTAVAEMQAETAISERRACQLVGLARSTLRYEPRRSPEDEQLQARIIELA